LSLKDIKYEYRAVNLLEDNQSKDEYSSMNPLKEIPTLLIDGHTLCESVAIMEYLEQTRPQPALLPADAFQRAKVRQVVETVVADIQPLQNLRVLKKVGEEKKMEWAQHWIDFGFQGLEKVLSKTAGKYCVGDDLTLADCVLVPQVYNALRFKVDMSKFPTISRLNAELSKLDSFVLAHPDSQPDFVKM